MRIIIAFSTLFLLIKVCSAQEIQWNQDHSIGLVPAKNWKKDSDPNKFRFELKSLLANPPFKGSIEIITAPSRNKSLNELWEIYVTEDFPKVINGFAKIDEGVSVVASKNANWIEFYTTDYNILFQMLTVCFVNDNTLFIITCTSVPKHHDKVEDEFWQMIETITLK
ncbi:hypothetical protein GCM10027429_26250 [Marivirga atlantica]|jgi:hypothetical protein|uniref:DUF1795 domain-containing protein n=1 Tax=Marivirga atlantica TaxID=1548457 RepID=A0A937A9R2_9BACT|nr:hypothetical protein [Marivirga atlantica]MBL0766225.1 hypothetical protein [Marivirga atlantica]